MVWTILIIAIDAGLYIYNPINLGILHHSSCHGFWSSLADYRQPDCWLPPITMFKTTSCSKSTISLKYL